MDAGYRGTILLQAHNPIVGARFISPPANQQDKKTIGLRTPMVISSGNKHVIYTNVSMKSAIDTGCTQASETTLYEYTIMMVVATWAPPDLETSRPLACENSTM